MAWTTEILESIHQVDPEEWDRLVQGRPFANWRWLEMTEAVLVNHQPRYLLLRQDEKLQAGIVCALQRHFQSPLLQSTLGWYIRRFPGLRCGVPISYDPSLFFCDQEQSGVLLPALMQGLQSLIRRERVSFYTIDHLAEGDAAWAFLRSQGYHRIEHLAEIYLDIHWTSFESYLTSLPHKKRSEYVRINGHLEREGITLEAADLRTEDKNVLERLVNNVFQRHKEPTMYQRDLFQRANDLLGEDFKLIVARQNGESIGCMTLLRSGNEWLAKCPV
jgi:predicted N-acyltransferase